ncbi:MAG: hypothetical protein J0I79_16565 [Mesorhizobium sp.]|uniref:hypothetical protein n=1 Tax=Mesorhizobium sp. TaxID=1871066 RepID=UPI001ACE81E4|nr:hypothetical protein [Mesorhizobium sp.]MBN9219560.1 hypothetical protein [Mesorhizobium sp.]
MNAARENALKLREELKAKLAEVETYLALEEKFASLSETNAEHGTLRNLRIVGTGSRRMLQLDDDTDTKRKRNIPKDVMEKEVRSLITEAHKRPMTRTELVEALELKGVPVAGADPSKALGTILWRMGDKFINIKGFGYWPRDLEYEPAGYRPPDNEPPSGDQSLPGVFS